ncbi:unnamed protein product, partial [Tetraodon nigroviridis]
NGSAKQDLVIEELQSSPDKSKKRAMSIEAAEKEWEEKRQNMGHYDGKEFEKILQEAQANMMKGIPSLEIEDSAAVAPAATEQASTHNPAESVAGKEKAVTEPPSDTSSKKGPEKFPKPTLEKPAKPVLERPSRTVPRSAPAVSLSKQESEKPNKSPPPPPPRKIFPGSGMTTTRSGEVVFISRKESISSQEGEEDVAPPTPKAKPNKVPPETKPKPATPPPVTFPAAGEEEDEGDKIMAELQVFQKCTVKDVVVENSVEPTTHTETQIRELRSGSLLPLKEKKIIYYVTGQIPKEQPTAPGSEESPERREPAQTSPQRRRLRLLHNIAFMITNTKVQALSCGEYQELVNAKKGSVQTVTVAMDHVSVSSSSSSSFSDSGVNTEPNGDAKQDGKKKFKFKFPKKQLAALTQAIRTGTKSGKKTLQVVVYEDEEEYDGTIRQHKEAKRFEIACSKPPVDTPKVPGLSALNRQNSDSVCRTNEIRKNTYKTLDSLEQTIKQLETTISEMGPHSPVERVFAEEPKAENVKSSEGAGVRRSSSLPKSRVSGPKNASVASPTSRMPVPLSAKARQSPGTTDKAGKQQKLQDAQRQFRQANGSAKRVGGDHKTSSPTVPVSKIPAFYPSSTKSSSQSAHNSEATNPINTSSSSSSSCRASSVTKSSQTPRSSSLPSSHIPSLSNGSLKLPTPLQHRGKALSFSSQTQNGR